MADAAAAAAPPDTDTKMADEAVRSRLYDWDQVRRDPKGDFGEFHTRQDYYKTMKYHLLDTGGFLRLCTDRGRSYWLAQNESFHTTPDFKLHVSVPLEFVLPAWKLLTELFVEMHCDFGMKMTTTTDAARWGTQRGREITVYMFVYDDSYPFIDDPDQHLDPVFERIYNGAFWRRFVEAAEALLQQAGIPSNGCADGDFPLTEHVSVRNEAYVDGVYPPNDKGYNAAGHTDVFGLFSLD